MQDFESVHHTEELFAQLPSLDAEATEKLRNLVEERIIQIRGQVELASGEAASEGMYADPSWFAKANAALRHWGRLHQSVLRHGGALKKKARAEEYNDIKHAFSKAAAAALTKKKFLEIAALAGWGNDYAQTFYQHNNTT